MRSVSRCPNPLGEGVPWLTSSPLFTLTTALSAEPCPKSEALSVEPRSQFWLPCVTERCDPSASRGPTDVFSNLCNGPAPLATSNRSMITLSVRRRLCPLRHQGSRKYPAAEPFILARIRALMTSREARRRRLEGTPAHCRWRFQTWRGYRSSGVGWLQ